MKCDLCHRLLIPLGFDYYGHPELKDHFGRTQPEFKQCSKLGEISKIK